MAADRQTAEAYEANLWEDLQSLLNRAKSGTYRGPPVLERYPLPPVVEVHSVCRRVANP